jgi:hypothetical protein
MKKKRKRVCLISLLRLDGEVKLIRVDTATKTVRNVALVPRDKDISALVYHVGSRLAVIIVDPLRKELERVRATDNANERRPDVALDGSAVKVASRASRGGTVRFVTGEDLRQAHCADRRAQVGDRCIRVVVLAHHARLVACPHERVERVRAVRDEHELLSRGLVLRADLHAVEGGVKVDVAHGRVVERVTSAKCTGRRDDVEHRAGCCLGRDRLHCGSRGGSARRVGSERHGGRRRASGRSVGDREEVRSLREESERRSVEQRKRGGLVLRDGLRGGGKSKCALDDQALLKISKSMTSLRVAILAQANKAVAECSRRGTSASLLGGRRADAIALPGAGVKVVRAEHIGSALLGVLDLDRLALCELSRRVLCEGDLKDSVWNGGCDRQGCNADRGGSHCCLDSDGHCRDGCRDVGGGNQHQARGGSRVALRLQSHQKSANDHNANCGKSRSPWFPSQFRS